MDGEAVVTVVLCLCMSALIILGLFLATVWVRREWPDTFSQIELRRYRNSFAGCLSLSTLLAFCCMCFIVVGVFAPAQVGTEVAADEDTELTATVLPTNTPEPTSEPTEVLTAAPAPTDTPFPTNTPELSTATSFPEPTNSPTPTVRPGVPLDVQLYFAEVIENTEAIRLALQNIGELAENPLFFDEDWRTDMVINMALIRVSHQSLQELNPPEEVRHIHTALLDATSDCNAALDHIAAGIDNLDPEEMDIATRLNESCADKARIATRLITEYLE